eukprot:gene28075-36963_t
MAFAENQSVNSTVDGRVKEVMVDSRINKVLAMRTDSVAMLEALDAISEFYSDNTVDARRMLKQDLELQNIQLAKKFLSEFDEVRTRILSVESLSDRLTDACAVLEKKLSESEVDLLYHANLENIDTAEKFFDSLNRLKSAYTDCKNMVEKHFYSVGFELLEILGQHQDIAYQHLFDWVKKKCDALAETAAGNISTVKPTARAIDLNAHDAVKYVGTFQRIIPLENAVHSTVRGCLLECKRLFTAALNKQAELLTQSPVSYPIDLKASHVTKECAGQIQEILRVFNSTLAVSQPDPTDPCNIDTVLGNIIQPLLQSCRLGCQTLNSAEMAIFMLNNVAMIQHEISDTSKRFDDVKSGISWLQLLETEASTWVDILVKEEVARTLKRSDLDKLLELIEVVPAGLRASDQVGLGQDRVSTVMRSFYASLFSTMAPQFERMLQDPLLREDIRTRTAERIAEVYGTVFAFISNTANGYDATLLSHSKEEVRVLLGCVQQP